MRIGIDARQLTGRPTGVGRYLEGLVRQWALDPLSHEFVLYAPEDIALVVDTRRFGTRLVPGRSGTWWQQVRLPLAVATDRLDVFFAPEYTSPLALKTPTVVAIHDVSFAAHPEWYRLREGVRLRCLARLAAAHARRVITISEFSRGELTRHLGVPDDKIRVIPPGIPPRHVVPAGSKAPRLLYVGSIFNRRHVVDLIRAFAPIARAHPESALDIVGDNRSYPREDVARVIAVERVEDQVRWHEYASDEQLRDLYARARAFAFLSEYEGLGLTPLEALSAGVPPVLLDTPVARESCGDAALYVTPGSVGAVTAALERVLFDDQMRERLLGASPVVLAKYSWPRAARATLAALVDAAG
jgi:glycosyltransferase involved in cell wall biosynthesis